MRTSLFASVVCLLLLDCPPIAAMHATAPPTSAQLVARSLATDSTRNLLALVEAYRNASRVERRAALRALRAAALERRRLLIRLVERDPAGLLAVALPQATRDSLPPTVRNAVEHDDEVEGVLEVFHVDAGTASRFLYFVNAARGRTALFSATELPAAVTTGTHLRVRGKRIGRSLATGGTGSSLDILAIPASTATGVQQTAVLLVNFQDLPTQPFTPDAVRTTVFSNASAFDQEVSYNRTWLQGDVFGWYTIGLSSTTCDTGTLATQARAAATGAGVDLSVYHRFVYVFPTNACTWAGLGMVGGDPSHAWLNGIVNTTIVAHEMGHNFGLYHSHGLDCSTSAGCTGVEYGDTLDVMGQSVSGHFNAFQKERLGWLGATGAPPITGVMASGTYALDPYESVGTAPKALKILKSTDPATGARTFYYVELRRPIGFDASFGASANLMGGVIVRTGSEASGNSSFLLDMTPETATMSDPALAVGRTFTDASAGISIEPTSVGNAGATVAVTVGSTACVRGPTTTALSPTTAAAVAGGQVALAIAIDNGDSPTCPSSTVQLSATAPDGWTASFNSAMPSIPAGGSSTATLTLSIPAGAPAGSYTVAVFVTPGSGPSLEADATVQVAAGPSVRVTTDRPVYPPSTYVFITTLATIGDRPLTGAAVALTVTKPNGGTLTRNLTTDVNGAATGSIRLRRASLGIYRVDALVSAAGVSTAAGTTTFAVQ